MRQCSNCIDDGELLYARPTTAWFAIAIAKTNESLLDAMRSPSLA